MLYIFFYIFIVRDSTWITHLKKSQGSLFLYGLLPKLIQNIWV